MPSSDSSHDLRLEQLAAEFVERHRNGEHPPLSEYVERHPELAADIRDLFPALIQLEKLKPPTDATGDFEPIAGMHGKKLERLGDYRILREVGRGGMGVVYEAEQESLGRHVALKVLPSAAHLTRTYLERFRREAKAAAKLHHTNIVPVFGVGEHEGVPYYAMQYICGEGLDKVLDDVRRLRQQSGGPPVPEGSVAHSLMSGHFDSPTLAASESGGDPSGHHSGLSADGPEVEYCRGVARVGAQVADALGYAHRQGVLHRDIKPSNLLLDAQGTVWITDFGLAKSEGTDELTNTGDIVGTIRFMAPERFDGRSLPQSDVYGLGLTMYELLTLRPAFEDANRGKLIDKVLHEPVVPPRKIDGHIPRDLETIVLKCLAKDPLERYARAEDVAEDLRRFLADRPIKARRASSAEKVWRWCRRNPVIASLLGTVAALVVVVAVVSTILMAQLRVQLGETLEAERKARKREAEALVGEVHGIRQSRRIGQRFTALDKLRQATAIGKELKLPTEWYDRLRNEAIACLALPDVRLAKKFAHGHSPTQYLAVDPAYERYARVDLQGTVSVHRLADDAELYRWAAFKSAESSSQWSPDGRHLAIHLWSGDKALTIWRLEGAKAVPALPPFPNTSSWDFSPTGSEVVVRSLGGTIVVYDLTTRKVVQQRTAQSGSHLIAWHPTKRQVAISNGTAVSILDLDTRQPLGEEIGHPARVSQLLWHPHGHTVAAVCDNLKIYLTSLDRPKYPVILEGIRNGGVQVVFNHAGDLLLSTGWENIIRCWHTSTGKEVFKVPGHLHGTQRFGPGDRQIVATAALSTGEQVTGLWDVATFREYRTFTPVPVGGQQPTTWGGMLHPDGQWLAVTSGNGPVLWDLPTGRQLAFLPLGYSPSLWFESRTSLLTSTHTGLFRWPVQNVSEGRLRIGPPERLTAPSSANEHISCSRDGKVLAQARRDGAIVQHADRPHQPIYLQPHDAAIIPAVSPDGRWVVTSTHNGVGVKVWDSATGKLVKQLREDAGSGTAAFSPDGRWLTTTHGGLRVWSVESWREKLQLPGSHWQGFTVDGELMCYYPGK